jgi:putative tryptophan/tyrosine transport system substrate-binding protein
MIGQTRVIAALALAFFAWSVSADAQQPTKVPRVGILSDESPLLAADTFEPFAQGLRDLGYVEGQNITFEQRYAEEKDESLPRLAAELVGLQPNVILAIGTPAARAAKTATQTIPIVFARISDPIGLGFVTALARPGGNLTGVSLQLTDIEAKRLEFLITAVPDVRRVGVLWIPWLPSGGPELREIEGLARSLILEVVPAEVRSPDDLEPAILALVEQGVGALIVVPGPIFTGHISRMVDLTAKARLPAMFWRKEHVEAGGLMSYGTNYVEMYRRAAAYVDKILKGAKPADIPVEQPTRFELVINLKTAKALGLTIPPLLLARADEVIE